MKYPTNLATFKRYMAKGGVLTLLQAASSLDGKSGEFGHRMHNVPTVSADDATGASLVLIPVDPKHDAAWTVRYGPADDWSFEGNLVYQETDDLWLAWEIDHG